MLLGYYLTVKNRALNWVKLGLTVARSLLSSLVGLFSLVCLFSSSVPHFLCIDTGVLLLQGDESALDSLEEDVIFSV